MIRIQGGLKVENGWTQSTSDFKQYFNSRFEDTDEATRVMNFSIQRITKLYGLDKK